MPELIELCNEPLMVTEHRCTRWTRARMENRMKPEWWNRLVERNGVSNFCMTGTANDAFHSLEIANGRQL